MFDPADFIIERYVQNQAAWHNSRITYRIMRWDEQSKRRCLEGEAFWLGTIHGKLKSEFGILEPEKIPIVDLTSE